jgi:hypothetical protein
MSEQPEPTEEDWRFHYTPGNVAWHLLRVAATCAGFAGGILVLGEDWPGIGFAFVLALVPEFCVTCWRPTQPPSFGLFWHLLLAIVTGAAFYLGRCLFEGVGWWELLAAFGIGVVGHFGFIEAALAFVRWFDRFEERRLRERNQQPPTDPPAG